MSVRQGSNVISGGKGVYDDSQLRQQIVNLTQQVNDVGTNLLTYGDEGELASSIKLNADTLGGKGLDYFATATQLGDISNIVNNSVNNIVPVGTVICIASTNIPTGFLECNGSAINRTTYSNLFSAIGTTYGIGDGSATFNIPDLRGEFIRGFDNGRGVDTARVLGTSQVGTEVAGYIGERQTFTSRNVDGVYTISTTSGAYGTATSGGGANNFSVGTIRPRNIAMKYCIKY